MTQSHFPHGPGNRCRTVVQTTCERCTRVGRCASRWARVPRSAIGRFAASSMPDQERNPVMGGWPGFRCSINLPDLQVT